MATSVKVTKAIEAHLRQWQKISERMQKIVATVVKQQRELQRAMQPILESQAAHQKTLETILAAQEKWRNSIASLQVPRYELPDFGQLEEQAKKFRKSIEDAITTAFEELQRSFRELPPKTQEALVLLGKHGWYLDLEMPLPSLWQVKKALKEGNVQEVEEALAEYYEERLGEIETSICTRAHAM